MADRRLPVSVLTGFLGSGKTTLLSSALGHPAMGETAVIVNELGEIAIDHHLLRRVDERTVLLRSGCICCTLRGDALFERAFTPTKAAAIDESPFIDTRVGQPYGFAAVVLLLSPGGRVCCG